VRIRFDVLAEWGCTISGVFLALGPAKNIDALRLWHNENPLEMLLEMEFEEKEGLEVENERLAKGITRRL
jgi:hypothetical protein